MEFLEIMRLQARGGGGSVTERLRKVRVNEKQMAQAEKRREQMRSGRSIPAPQPSPPRDPAALRREQLVKWREQQRAARAAAAKKKKPPFKVGVVHHKQVYDAPPPKPLPRRSARLRTPMPVIPPKPLTIPSFAPPTAAFRPPIIKAAKKSAKKQNNASKSTPRLSIFCSSLMHVDTPARRTITTFNLPPEIEIEENGSNLPKTPSPVKELIDIHISPFVSMCRGRGSTLKQDLERFTKSPEKSAQYFRIQLDSEIERLNVLCDEWENYRSNTELEEDNQDSINAAVGQTRLLITKKFKQFRDLIDQCETQYVREGEGVVKAQDLQGFWDMVYMQVEDVDIRFNNLKKLRDNNWKEERRVVVAKKSKPKPIKKTVSSNKASNGLRAAIQAARMQTKQTKPSPKKADMIEFDGGFFSVKSPAKTRLSKSPNSLTRRSITKRTSVQSPLNIRAMINSSILSKGITNICLNSSKDEGFLVDLKKTPARSILKTPIPKADNQSFSKKNMKVFFNLSDADPEDSAPIEENLDEPKDFMNVDDKIIPDKRRKNVKRKSFQIDSENIADNEIVKKPKINDDERLSSPLGDNENASPNVSDSLEKVTKPKRGRNKKVSNDLNTSGENLNSEEVGVAKNKRRGRKRAVLTPVNEDKLISPILNSENNDIASDINDEFEDSFLASITSHKRKSSMMKTSRLSYNLIKFDSPDASVRITRSVAKRILTTDTIE